MFYNGQLLVARKVMASYLRQLLAHDSRMEQFVLEEMEQEHHRSVDIISDGHPLSIDIGEK